MSRTPLPLPSRAALRRIFDYNPRTGILTRRHQPNVPRWINTRFAGLPAGSLAKSGHVMVNIGYQRYYAHRLIWKLVHNMEPPEVDHENLNAGDNRLKNLRPSTHAQNTANASSRKTVNFHLPKGVFANRTGSRVFAGIKCNGVHHRLGSFSSPKEAHAAYCRAARRLHKEFARFN